jgi:hypothetical protein
MLDMKEIRNAYKILVEIFEEKRSLGSNRNRREDNLKNNLRGAECECVDLI